MVWACSIHERVGGPLSVSTSLSQPISGRRRALCMCTLVRAAFSTEEDSELQQ